MKTYKKNMPLITVFGIREHIDTKPDFQRPTVWSTSQKQLLVDTILRDYDVPKLYWRKTGSKPDRYDVVDGQQRLRALWEFFEGGYKLPKNSDLIDGEDISNCKYSDLPHDLRAKLDIYNLDVVVLEETDEDEVREMFLRLQNGTSLKAQEKRNAYSGKMRDFIRDLSSHPFFQSVAFKNSRFSYDHVAAQLVCLEINGGPTNIKNADLNRLYDENRDFDNKSPTAKAVKRTLDILATVFPEKTPELERYNVISLYCVMAELLRSYVIDEIKPKLHDWFVKFEASRFEHILEPEDKIDPEWVTYNSKISHSTDAVDSVRHRMEFILRNLLQSFPALSRKDGQRDFTHLQKLAIFRRDNGLCQIKRKCEGVKLTWDDWHCDHITPHSKGGKTTVENGQVSCSVCNLSKGNGT